MFQQTAITSASSYDHNHNQLTKGFISVLSAGFHEKRKFKLTHMLKLHFRFNNMHNFLETAAFCIIPNRPIRKETKRFKFQQSTRKYLACLILQIAVSLSLSGASSLHDALSMGFVALTLDQTVLEVHPRPHIGSRSCAYHHSRIQGVRLHAESQKN